MYGEIVGNLPTGSAIQGQYDYGCVGGEHAFYVYRITKTDESGTAFEYSWEQIKEYCVSRELKHVPEYYYGSLKDFYFRFVNPGNELSENFRDEIFKYLLTAFNLEKDCEFCRNVVPAEGIVVRVDGRKHYNAFKLKSKRFKLRENEELEAGVVDIESQE